LGDIYSKEITFEVIAKQQGKENTMLGDNEMTDEEKKKIGEGAGEGTENGG